MVENQIVGWVNEEVISGRQGCCIEILLAAGHEPKAVSGPKPWVQIQAGVGGIIELSSGHSRLAPLNLLASCSLSDLGDSGLEER